MIESFGLPKTMLQQLDPLRVQMFLSAAGWEEHVPPPYPEVSLFLTDEVPGSEVLLAKNPSYSDYCSMMSELIRTLSVVQKRMPWDLLNELLSPEGDIVKFRLISPYANRGQIPLTAGVRLLHNGKESLVAAACSAHNKQPAYYNKSFKEVTDFIDTCVLGQTEVGSFVVPIIVPVPSTSQYDEQKRPLFKGENRQLGFEYEPFSRRVSLTFMKGLAALQDAGRTRRHDQFNEELPDGVSANLCEALSAMRPPGLNSDVEINISWSASRPKRPSEVVQTVLIQNNFFDVIDRVGKHLRGTSTEADVVIEGLVRELSDKHTREKDHRGIIFVERTDAEDRGSLVKIILAEREYALACDAHKSQTKIVASGKLYRNAKMQTATLRGVRRFRLLGN